MLLKDFLQEGTASLERLYPRPESHSLLLMLCKELLGTESYTHILEPQKEIDPKALPALEAALARLCKGEPIQYVTGRAEFCGFSFRVTPDVLIPRPETELLVREAVKLAAGFSRPVRVLDLCTGSGCIAWSVALLVPGAKVVGVDISSAALEVARAQKLSCAQPPVFVQADILEAPQAFPDGPFDLVLSNPPYILESEKAQMRPNVLEHEPALALFVPDGDPLLFYRAVAQWSARLLSPGGVGLAEINETLGAATEAVFRDTGFSKLAVENDFFDKNRYIRYSK